MRRDWRKESQQTPSAEQFAKDLSGRPALKRPEISGSSSLNPIYETVSEMRLCVCSFLSLTHATSLTLESDVPERKTQTSSALA
jgi:hypothetical protein